MKDIVELFEEDLVRAYLRAKCLCAACKQPAMSAEALMAGILENRAGEASHVLTAHLDAAVFGRACSDAIKARSPKAPQSSVGAVVNSIDTDVEAAFKLADQYRRQENARLISTRHLAFALIRSSRGLKRILKKLGIQVPSLPKLSIRRPPTEVSLSGPTHDDHPTSYHLQHGQPCWCWRHDLGSPNSRWGHN